MYYKEPVYRPPSEAKSLLLQVTEGCTYKCSFCIGNAGKKFLIRPVEEIQKDVDCSKALYENNIKRIFFLDGNAFVLSPEKLIEIARYCYDIHPNLNRIGAYAHAKDILAKSPEELKRIRKAGIKIVYLGIETGDEQLLQQINKRVVPSEIADAVQLLHEADITLSGTIILGLAGNDPDLSRRHAIKTAELVNKLKPRVPVPWYISALTLMIPPGTQVFKQRLTGKFKPLSDVDILREMKIFFEHLDDDLEKCIFRSNHSSNYLPLESNNFARNKDQLIETINVALDNPKSLRKEFMRGL